MKRNQSLRNSVIAFLTVAAIGVAPILAQGAKQLPQTAAMKTGVSVQSNAKAAVDTSNLSEGYVMIRYTGGSNVRIKAQISRGSAVYTYDLNNKGTNEIFPLTEGDGSYAIKVFENTTGNKYAQAYSTTVDLKLRDEFLPFLYANQYVNFNSSSKAVAKAAELVKGKKTDIDKLTAVYSYVVKNTAYDHQLAKTVQSGYLPNVDNTLATGKGICFDYASLMAAMLRSQGIPSKLVIGYAGDIYHAWLNVYIDGQGWIEKAVYFDGENWSLMDPTFVSTSGDSSAASKVKYTMKYAY